MIVLCQLHNMILLLRALMGAWSLQGIKTRLGGARLKRSAAALTIAALMLNGAAAFAQTATPIPPTATMVILVIPINSIFTQANNWISTLSPIASLGIGVIIALAVFGFLAKAIKSAFG